MIIDETPLSGRVTIETGSWGGSSYTWTDQTDNVLNAVYSEGGRLGTPGTSMVDVGTLAITYREISTIPAVNNLVRIRRTGTSEYFFTGYIQDVAQKLVIDPTVSTTVPVTFTTIYCLDWVGLLSQFQVAGAAGFDASQSTRKSLGYDIYKRIQELNNAIDSTNATVFITLGPENEGQKLSDTSLVASAADHMELATVSAGAYWYATHNLPTNPTTGRDNLIEYKLDSTNVSSGKTFTDEVGSVGDLHYTEIDVENSSANVANNIVVRNANLVYPSSDQEVTKFAGGNEQNFILVRGEKDYGLYLNTEWTYKDDTSIATYGNRIADVSTNVSTQVMRTYLAPTYYQHINLIANPSVEYSDLGYSGGANSRVRRRQPLRDANPFTAFSGEWAMRSRQIVGTAGNAQISYTGGESDGIPVVDSNWYTFKARAARGTVSRTDMRAQTRVFWYDVTETQIGSVVQGTNVSLTTANTWYELTSGRIQAPVGAVRATVQVFFTRTGGGSISNADIVWADGFQFFIERYNTGTLLDLDYFDGDTTPTNDYLYGWTGQVGDSPSVRYENTAYDVGVRIAAKYASTSLRATRIRWNAQENLGAVSSLTVGKTISLKFNGTTATYRIIGIDGELTYNRYMIDFYLLKI